MHMVEEKRDKHVQVSEVKQGLRRLRLACRLGVAARDLASDTVEVPREGIGRVSQNERASTNGARLPFGNGKSFIDDLKKERGTPGFCFGVESC